MATSELRDPTASGTRRRGTRSARQQGAATPNLAHIAPQPLLDPIRGVGRETISWKRKVFHIFGIGVVGLTYGLTSVPLAQALVILGSIAAVFCSLDVLRFYVPTLRKRVRRDFGEYMRDYELDRLSGSSWFLLAAVLTIGVFSREAAAAGFICLALGDPLASWVGVRWGRIRLPGGKSLEGSFTLFATCLVASALYFVAGAGMAPGLALALAGGAALSAAVSEWLPLRVVDDNFVVPILTAAGTTACMALIG